MILFILFNTWSRTNHIPENIKIGIITSIPKCEEASSPDKYRPITLLPIIYKIYERILLKIIQKSGIESKIYTLQGVLEVNGVF